MKKNVGAFDGVARLILSWLIFSYAALVGPFWLAILSLPLIANAAFYYCPLYDMAGISTCHENSSKNS